MCHRDRRNLEEPCAARPGQSHTIIGSAAESRAYLRGRANTPRNRADRCMRGAGVRAWSRESENVRGPNGRDLRAIHVNLSECGGVRRLQLHDARLDRADAPVGRRHRLLQPRSLTLQPLTHVFYVGPKSELGGLLMRLCTTRQKAPAAGPTQRPTDRPSAAQHSAGNARRGPTGRCSGRPSSS